MIVSKPKPSTLISISLFLVIAYGAGIWTLMVIPDTPIIWYTIPFFCFTTAVVITIKVLLGYRRLFVDKEKWKIKRLIGKNFIFDTRDIVKWKVTEIKTGSGLFRELQIYTPSGNVKVSLQEHTEYQKIYKKVHNKCPKKQIVETS